MRSRSVSYISTAFIRLGADADQLTYRYIHLKGTIWDLSSCLSRYTKYSCVEIFVHFIKRRPTSALELVLDSEDDAGVNIQRSKSFKKYKPVHWNLDTSVIVLCIVVILRDSLAPYCRYVRSHTRATLTIRQLDKAHLKISIAEVSTTFESNKFGDDRVVGLKSCAFVSEYNDRHHTTLTTFTDNVTVDFGCGRSQSVCLWPFYSDVKKTLNP